MALLEIENLQVQFRTPDGVNRAVNGVSFHVNEGEHKQHRRLLMPAFHRSRIESYRDEMVRATESLLEKYELRDPALRRMAAIIRGADLPHEEGAPSEVKLQQGIGSQTRINEAVLDSLRRAKFRPALKNGVPVKMWHTVVVDVKP